MKATIHIALRQYSFLEVEVEGTKEEIIKTYLEIAKHYEESDRQSDPF